MYSHLGIYEETLRYGKKLQRCAYGRIGSGAEGFKGPRGRNCNRRLSNSTEPCSSCKGLQLAPPSEKTTMMVNTITITMKSILLVQKLAMSNKNNNALQLMYTNNNAPLKIELQYALYLGQAFL